MKEDEHHHEPEKLHRTQALVEVAVEKAIGGRPSTGAAPRLLQLLDPTSPSTTATIEGKSSRIQPPNNHITRNHLCALEAKEGQQPPHQPERETYQPRTQKQNHPAPAAGIGVRTSEVKNGPGKLIP